MDNKLEYKIRLWEQLQGIVIENESRNTGSISILTVVACASSLFVILSDDKLQLLSIFYYMVPLLIMLCLFVYTFNNRVSAITRGYLAGLEDSINEDLGENIYIHNKGYKELYHIPYFIVNDIIAIVYLCVLIVATYICFKNIFMEQLIPMFLIMVYFMIYIVFILICVYELQTNGEIKRISRIYFHTYQKENTKFDISTIDYKISVKKVVHDFDKKTEQEVKNIKGMSK